MPRHKISHYNTLRGPVEDDGTAAAVKAEFGRRLEAARIERGWNQSELARRASGWLPKPVSGQKQGHAVGRDLISHYTRGISLPRPEILQAIAKALGKDPAELLPPHRVPSTTATLPKFRMTSAGDGKFQISVNQIVSLGVATKIMELLAPEDKG